MAAYFYRFSESTGGSGSSRNVEVREVSFLAGGAASLPCDITGGDTVYTVLWYRGNMGQPFYT